MNNAGTATAVTIPEVVAIVFVVLKLCGVIAWSWWWVLSPVWICWGITLVTILILVILYGIRRITRKRRRC